MSDAPSEVEERKSLSEKPAVALALAPPNDDEKDSDFTDAFNEPGAADALAVDSALKAEEIGSMLVDVTDSGPAGPLLTRTPVLKLEDGPPVVALPVA